MGRAGIRLTVAGVQTERGELAVAVSEVCMRKRKSEGRVGVQGSVITSGEDRDEYAGCGAVVHGGAVRTTSRNTGSGWCGQPPHDLLMLLQ